MMIYLLGMLFVGVIFNEIIWLDLFDEILYLLLWELFLFLETLLVFLSFYITEAMLDAAAQ